MLQGGLTLHNSIAGRGFSVVEFPPPPTQGLLPTLGVTGVSGGHPPSSCGDKISCVYTGQNFYEWPLTHTPTPTPPLLGTPVARLPQARLKPLGDGGTTRAWKTGHNAGICTPARTAVPGR